MRYIVRARITSFRSIKDELVEFDRACTPLVGANNSGKSNLLRALNAFFNGDVEPGDPVAIGRDFRGRRRSKSKHDIRVAVELDFNSLGDMRAELSTRVTELAGQDQVLRIGRKWYFDDDQQDERWYFANADLKFERDATDEESRAIRRLLNVVPFRYIPNHIHPTELVEQEERALRRVLNERLARKRTIKDDVGNVISEIQSIAADEIATVRKDLLDAAPIADVKMRSPETAGDLAWAFDLQLADDEHEHGALESVVHGSGVQSVLAFHVLHLVDTRTMGRGWVKGAVWAIEEPESFLHFAMQTVLRDHLRAYTEGSMQVMLTTHSAVFACTSDRGQHVVRRSYADGGTAFSDRDSRELVRSCTASVFGFTHPLVVGELKPMLVVEGDSDRAMIVRALAFMGRISPWEIVTLNDLDPTFTGGWTSLKTWFRGNRSALEARDERSPVFVLLDEDVKAKDVKQIGDDLAIHPSSKVIRVAEALRNPELTLPGAEGWWSTEHVVEVVKSIGVKHTVKIVTDDAGNQTERKIQIKKSDHDRAKSALQGSISECSREALAFVEKQIVPFIDASSSSDAQTMLPLVGHGVGLTE